MANIKDDPKVQALVAKAQAAAVKQIKKTITDGIKEALAGAKDDEDKAFVKASTGAYKQALTVVKEAELEAAE